MIIDSHAHYNNSAYKKPFRYLSYDKCGYALKEGGLPQLMQEMEEAHILYFIEPGVSLQSCEEVLQLCSEYPGRIFPAIGVHPTRSIFEKWSDRHKLVEYTNTPGVIAIGEIGLDYHYKRKEQHRLKQHLWFIYQLNLAWKVKLPVILHVRDAHEDALRILPFDDASFDMVINRHGDFNPDEIHRVLKPGGLFITQQVGAENDRELVELLCGQTDMPFLDQYLKITMDRFSQTGFVILDGRECFRPIRFYDVGALVWFARIIQWEFPDFSVDHNLDRLLRAQMLLDREGVITGQIHRFILVAKKV